MGLRFPQQILGSCFFVTTTFHDRRKHGQIEGVYSALADSLKFCLEKYKVLLPGYVLMPSHVHLLLVIDGNSLADFMRDFKKFVSQKALKDCGIDDTQIWMPRYDRVAIHSEKAFRQKLKYIHNNPVRSGLVGIAKDWIWSSAGSYISDKPGPLPVWKEWLL
jgi:REP element-mobilizing transposase RayT